MKKAILAPLCSALVIPGLGQAINRQIKKAGMLLGATFILFLLGMVHLYRILANAGKETDLSKATFGAAGKTLASQDMTLLWILLGLFALLWIYSVLDAFRWGRHMDKDGEESGA